MINERTRRKYDHRTQELQCFISFHSSTLRVWYCICICITALQTCESSSFYHFFFMCSSAAFTTKEAQELLTDPTVSNREIFHPSSTHSYSTTKFPWDIFSVQLCSQNGIVISSNFEIITDAADGVQTISRSCELAFAKILRRNMIIIRHPGNNMVVGISACFCLIVFLFPQTWWTCSLGGAYA